MVQHISVKDAAKLENVSERLIRQRINENKINAKQTKSSKGAPGGMQWQIDPRSLSPSAQQKWMKRMAEANESRLEAEETKERQKPFYVKEEKRKGALLEDGKTINPAALQDVCGKEVFEREMKTAQQKYDVTKKAQEIINSRVNVTERIERFADECGVNKATIYRWVKKAEAGSAGLLRKRKTVVDGKTFHKISPEIETVIRHAYLQIGAPKVSAVKRKVDIFCKENDLVIPSKTTVYRFIDNLEETEAAMCCFARYGQTEYMRKFAPHGRRMEPERVMQIVMGDHHKFDFFINDNGRPVRPWCTMWFDVKSRCPVGWTVGTRANGDSIAMALAHMMSPKRISVINTETGEIEEQTLELGGLCETLYIDNGEDYKSRLKKKETKFDLDQKSLDLCQHLGIKTVFATPYHPQAKAHVERFFGTVAGIFSTEQPGWCGNSPENRPASLDEHKLCEKGKLLELSELGERFDDWIYNFYMKRVHGTIGQQPIEAHFDDSKLKKGWPQQSTLNMLRCIKDKAMIYKEGIRRFGHLYWHAELDKYVGQNVIIRFDPTHVGEIYVSTKKDGYICTATNASLMKWGNCADDIKKLQSRRKQAKKDIRERLSRDYDEYYSLQEIAKERQAKGDSILIGDIAESDGLMKAITPLDNTGNKIQKDRKDRYLKLVDPVPENKNNDPVDAMILGTINKTS